LTEPVYPVINPDVLLLIMEIAVEIEKEYSVYTSKGIFIISP